MTDSSGEFGFAAFGFGFTISMSVRGKYDRLVTFTGATATHSLSFSISLYNLTLLSLSGAIIGIGWPTSEFWYYNKPQSPTKVQQDKIDDAIKIIKASHGFEKYYSNSIYIMKDGDTVPWGISTNLQWYNFNSTIFINENALQLPDILLASLIVHESVHSRQIMIAKWFNGEPAAYDIQSKFLHSHNVSGKASQVTKRFGSGDILRRWVKDQAESMNEYNTKDPAISLD
jgi:hypothetical protein